MLTVAGCDYLILAWDEYGSLTQVLSEILYHSLLRTWRVRENGRILPLPTESLRVL